MVYNLGKHSFYPLYPCFAGSANRRNLTGQIYLHKRDILCSYSKEYSRLITGKEYRIAENALIFFTPTLTLPRQGGGDYEVVEKVLWGILKQASFESASY
jgi:hypothetical protein